MPATTLPDPPAPVDPAQAIASGKLTPSEGLGGGAGLVAGGLGGSYLAGRAAEKLDAPAGLGLNRLIAMGNRATDRRNSLVGQATLGAHSIVDRARLGPVLGTARTAGRAAPDQFRSLVGRLARGAQGNRKDLLLAAIGLPAMIGGAYGGMYGGIGMGGALGPKTAKVADLSPREALAAQLLAGLGGAGLAGAATAYGTGGKIVPGIGAGVGGSLGATAGTLAGGGLGAIGGGLLSKAVGGNVGDGMALGAIPLGLAGGLAGLFAGSRFGGRLAGAKPAAKAPTKAPEDVPTPPEPSNEEKKAFVRDLVEDVAVRRKVASRYLTLLVRKVARDRAVKTATAQVIGLTVLRRLRAQ